MKKFIIIAFTLFSISALFSPAFAAAKKPAKKAVVSSGISVSTQLRKDRRALYVYFKNLNAAKSVSYTLSYNSSNGPQGAMGTIQTKGKYSVTRELVFGTASNRVYKYDKNVKNAVLQVSAVLKTGKAWNKQFKIKI